MRIMQTVTSLGPGGVQSLVFELAERLVGQEKRIAILSFGPIVSQYHKESDDALKNRGIEIICPTKDLSSRLERQKFAYESVENFKPDIIHAHTPMPHIYICRAAKKLRLPIVATFHSYTMWPKWIDEMKAKFLFSTYLNKSTNHFVAISKGIKEVMKQKYHIPDDITSVIYNGVDISRFEVNLSYRKECRKYLSIAEDSFVITNVGRIEFDTKNQLSIIRIIKNIERSVRKARILFVGDGPDIDRLRALSREIPSVSVLGSRNDIPNILSASDVFILPSKREGLPVSILEAMAAGVPVVATDVGSVREVISDGVNGFVIGVDEIDRIPEILSILQNNRDVYSSVRDEAKKSVQSFSIEDFVEAHLELYCEILKKIEV